MNTVPMVSLKPHRYDHKDLQICDAFFAARGDVKLLVGLGRAQVKVELPEQDNSAESQDAARANKPKPQTRNQTARRNTGNTGNRGNRSNSRGRYHRRDQRAED